MRPPRRAFTLIELLVVLAIIGVLVALLLPATRRVREAAARTQCANNLKQIALALHDYHDRHRYFPCGTRFHPYLAPEERLSWCVAILPHLEQEGVYARFGLDDGWKDGRNQEVAQAPVRGFACPAAPPGPPDQPARTNYVGCAGLGGDAALLPPRDRRGGFFGYDRRLMPADIADGTSTTLAVVETTAGIGPWARGGDATVRGLDPARQPYVGEQGPFGTVHRSREGWRSARVPALANAALADGSVRPLPDTLAAPTFEALATVAGGENVGPDF